LVIEAAATLALRLPDVADRTPAWIADVAADPGAGTQTRPAALAEHARCAPALAGPDTVRTAVTLLDTIATTTTTTTRRGRPRPKSSVITDDIAPPQVLAAFDDLERSTRVHDATTRTLRTLHTALAERVALRAELLAEQFRSPAPGARLDAIRMATASHRVRATTSATTRSPVSRAVRGARGRLAANTGDASSRGVDHPSRDLGRVPDLAAGSLSERRGTIPDVIDPPGRRGLARTVPLPGARLRYAAAPGGTPSRRRESVRRWVLTPLVDDPSQGREAW